MVRKPCLIALCGVISSAGSFALNEQEQAQQMQQMQQMVQQKCETHIETPIPMAKVVTKTDLGGLQYTVRHHTHVVETKVVKEETLESREDWKEGEDIKQDFPAEKVECPTLDENWQTQLDKTQQDGAEKSIMQTNKAQTRVKVAEHKHKVDEHCHVCRDKIVTETNDRVKEEWEEVETCTIPPKAEKTHKKHNKQKD